jgi:hypothetical protein
MKLHETRVLKDNVDGYEVDMNDNGVLQFIGGLWLCSFKLRGS